MALYQLQDHAPLLHGNAWVADTAQVIGQVILHTGASVWFQSVLRGDTELLEIGAGSNIQDLSMVHADRGYPVSIGRDVTVGHQVMLHGCTVGDNSLIGIQAVLLNGCRIGRNSIVGAGSVVTEGKAFPDHVLILGSPAKIVRTLDDAAVERIRQSAQHYQTQARRFSQGLQRLNDQGSIDAAKISF